MISIIIPLYNQAEKFISTLESIVAQTYQDYEVIIVNDGSTDGPENRFASFSTKIQGGQRFLFLNQDNAGAPAARNRGLKEAAGDFLFFCDADAVLKPQALETMLSSLYQNPDASFAYSSFYWGRKFFRCGEFDQEKLKREPYIHTMSLIRRSDFPDSGWDQTLKKFQDWDLWLTMLENGKQGIWIDKPLFKVATGGRISSWLPSFAYRYLPFLKAVKKYKQWKKIVQDKHGLPLS